MSAEELTCVTCGAANVCRYVNTHKHLVQCWRHCCDACPDKEMTPDKVRAWFEEAARLIRALNARLKGWGNEYSESGIALCIGGGVTAAEVYKFQRCEFAIWFGALLIVAAWADAHLNKEGEYHE